MKRKKLPALAVAQIDAACSRMALAQEKIKSAFAELAAAKTQIATLCSLAGISFQDIERGAIGIATNGQVFTKEEIEAMQKNGAP